MGWVWYRKMRKKADGIFSRIRTNYHNLSDSQKKIADFILENPEVCIKNTLKETALQCNVSEATVFRFLNKIDYESYQLFRIDLAREKEVKTSTLTYGDINLDDSLEVVKDKIIYSTCNAIQDFKKITSKEVLDEFIKSIIKANKILIIGVGASFAVATDFFHKLIKMGFYCEHSNDPHMINLLASNLGERDLLIAVSHSGESREILDAVEIAKENTVKVAALTSYSQSSLATMGQLRIITPSYENNIKFDAMTSRIIQLIAVDIIYVGLLTVLGEKGMERLYESRKVVSKNKT